MVPVGFLLGLSRLTGPFLLSSTAFALAAVVLLIWLRPDPLQPARALNTGRKTDARSTGLRNLPLHDTAQNRIWLEIVQIALDLLAGGTSGRSLAEDADARADR